MRVLVIDDQAPVRRAICGVLHELGVAHVAEAGSGQNALQLVNAPGAQFDLILCELRMPGRDGIETIRTLAAAGVQSAVVIMSVEDERVIEIAGTLTSLRGLRLLGTIRKPVTREHLAPIVERARETRAAGPTRSASAPAGGLADAFVRHELQLFYQPKIALRRRQVAGVEALVRWRHPTLGLFQPVAFMPELESSDEHMALLTDFTLTEGIAFAGRWRRSGQPLGVAINLAARAFDMLDLPERIEQMASDAGVPPENITLEITETEVARDVVRLVDVGLRLHLKGFRLSVDDFGMGTSGLAQLQKVPFSELKIDREFVHGCVHSTLKRSVIEASLALARTLSMLSVAEGVQNPDDLAMLQSLGCDIVQGYHFAQPMSEEMLGPWLAQWAGAGRMES